MNQVINIKEMIKSKVINKKDLTKEDIEKYHITQEELNTYDGFELHEVDWSKVNKEENKNGNETD